MFSKNGQQYSVDKLKNLCKLLSDEESVNKEANSKRESLVGKKIKHRWRDEQEIEQWYLSEVLSRSSGTDEWYNIQYEGEDNNILTLNLHEDIDLGDLEVVE